jgi:hypothetical protein
MVDQAVALLMVLVVQHQEDQVILHQLVHLKEVTVELGVVVMVVAVVAELVLLVPINQVVLEVLVVQVLQLLMLLLVLQLQVMELQVQVLEDILLAVEEVQVNLQVLHLVQVDQVVVGEVAIIHQQLQDVQELSTQVVAVEVV